MSKRKFTETEKAAFRKFAESHAPKSRTVHDFFASFAVGGAICLIGQVIHNLYIAMGAQEETVKILLPVTLVFLSCVFTGFGLYEKLATFAGAGTLVPITGFANAVCSCAIDAKPEGLVLGVGAKMFTIAGPVIVYGTLASVIYGVYYYFSQIIM